MKVKQGYVITKEGKTLAFSLHRQMSEIYAKKAAIKSLGIQYRDIEKIVFEPLNKK